MNNDHIKMLRCLECGGKLTPLPEGGPAMDRLSCEACAIAYPVLDSIPQMLAGREMRGSGHAAPLDMGKPHQQEYWEHELGPRQADHAAIRAFALPKLDLVEATLRALGDDPKKMSALEIGSGSGYLTAWAGPRFGSLTASDYSTNRLRINPHGEKVCCDGTRLPYSDDAFDCVICGNVLHHVSVPKDMVMEMRRVSRKHIIFLEPNRNNPLMYLYGLLQPAERGLLKMSLSWLRGLCARCGLAETLATTHGLVLPNKTPPPLVGTVTAMEPYLRPHFYLVVMATK